MVHTATGASDHVGTSLGDNNTRRKPRKRKAKAVAFFLQAMAMVGIAALLYPTAADWFSRLGQDSEISGYVREVEQLPSDARLAQLQIAQEYNANIPSGVLRDPYTASGQARDISEDASYQSYLDVLRIGKMDVIGEVSYPSLGISLPIYHGTSDEVLSRGIGHLYGSSLPVGGPSTHSVMTSHSGLVNASLFTDLPDAEIGDVFTVTVLGAQQYYQVRHLETVLPDQTDRLRIIDGEDWVTLITCTPIGINSHRLLVQAERIDAPPGDGDRIISGNAGAGFPWWAVLFLVGSAGTAYFMFAPPRRTQTAKITANQDLDHLTEDA